MAAGSQALKGIWALFVKAAKVKANIRTGGREVLTPSISLRENEEQNKPNGRETKISESPTRFEIAVRSPALNALLLL